MTLLRNDDMYTKLIYDDTLLIVTYFHYEKREYYICLNKYLSMQRFLFLNLHNMFFIFAFCFYALFLLFFFSNEENLSL